MWIDSDYYLKEGDTGFLVRRVHLINREAEEYHLDDRPPYTNVSHQPRLNGWCGSWNDVSTYGEGMARVVRVTDNGRALVKALKGKELAEALEAAGYPELGD